MTDKTPTTVDDDEFYIGYAPPMPPRDASFVTRAVVALIGGAAVWAGVVASGHVHLDGGTFNFGHPESFSGTMSERPYPRLLFDRSPGGPEASVLLVAAGKHGADELVRGFDGRHVTFKGTRIHRASATMIEIHSGSLTTSPAPGDLTASDPAPTAQGGTRTFVGEVVDSKCFLGVMVPGEGKTHKDCASLCLRGGIPPALLVRNQDGTTSLVLLTSSTGQPIGPKAIDAAGEMISVSGTLEEQQGWLTLKTDSAGWTRTVAESGFSRIR